MGVFFNLVIICWRLFWYLMYFSSSFEIMHMCCEFGRGNWLWRVLKIMCNNGVVCMLVWSGLYQCVFSNDETMHLCYDIERGNGEPLILFWILLQFVVCCCGICYFDVFLSSRLGVYALVLWWLWCCIFTCAVPLYFYINKSFYLYLKKQKKTLSVYLENPSFLSGNVI